MTDNDNLALCSLAHRSPRELFALAHLELDRRDDASSATDRTRHTIIAMFLAEEAWRQVALASDQDRSVH